MSKVKKIRLLNSMMNEIYTRISVNKPFDNRFKSYTKEDVTKVVDYFESIEDYEKCNELTNFIQTRFKHK